MRSKQIVREPATPLSFIRISWVDRTSAHAPNTRTCASRNTMVVGKCAWFSAWLGAVWPQKAQKTTNWGREGGRHLSEIDSALVKIVHCRRSVPRG